MKLFLALLLFLPHAAWTCLPVNQIVFRFCWVRKCLPVILSEYVDKNDVQAVDFINQKTLSNLYISDGPETKGNKCNRDLLMKMETYDDIVDVDNNYMDPQMCATIACDIYKHLHASEVKKRPSTDFMEKNSEGYKFRRICTEVLTCLASLRFLFHKRLKWLT